MTIAMCYVSPEGVVFGADSTASSTQNGFHYFNSNQKLFEVGAQSTLGALTWGLSGLMSTSYRTLLADLGAGLEAKPPPSVEEVMQRWIDSFWAAYTSDSYLLFFNQLHAKSAFDPALAADLDRRTQQEEELYNSLRFNLVVGFCIAGRVNGNRTPSGYEVIFDPLLGKPTAVEIPMGTYRYWGAPNMAERLIFGTDMGVLSSIMKSGKWSGSMPELQAIAQDHKLEHGVLPIREAVDFVHMCIHSTIKALKFSRFSQICGGPIELSVVTTDRPYRWVRHKSWDTAIAEGQL